MNNVASPSPLSWNEFAPAVVAAWNRFFFSPFDLRVVGVIRIVYAAVILVNVLVWYPDLTLWFGEDGLMPYATLESARGTTLRPGAWSLWDVIPTTERALHIGYGCFVVQLVLLLIGYMPRFQAASVFVWLISFQHRTTLIWDGEDSVMRLIGFFVMLMPLEKIWARDWRWRPSGQTANVTAATCWSLRLMQIQICCIYLATAFAKLRGNTWWDGTAVYFASRLDDFFRPDAVPDFLFETPWIVRCMTWSVLVIELAVPILIWFRESRRWALLLAFVFHAACQWSMNLFLFHAIMACGWLAFLAADDFEMAARLWRRVRGRSS